MDVDFIYKGWNCSIGMAVLRWKPGQPEHSILSAFWDDEWVLEMLHTMMRDEMDKELRKRHKKADRKYLSRAFKEEFTQDECLEFMSKGFKRVKAFAKKEGESTPNIDIIPGRKVEQ